MARAVARVEQKIIITGADNASDAINKARASLGKLETSAKRTGKSVKNAGAHAKTAFSHGLPGLQGKHDSFNRLSAAVGGAGGALQESTHSIALLDAAMRLVPGPVGAAGAAIAGLTALTYSHVKAANQAREKMRQAFGGEMLADITSLQHGFSLSAESAITLGVAMQDSGKSAADVHDELVNVVNEAEAVGADGSEAVSKFAASLTKGVTEAQKLTNRLKALGVEIELANLKSAAGGSFLEQFAGAAGVAADKNIGSMAAKLKAATLELKRLEAGTKGPLANYERHLSTVNKIAIGLGLSTKMAKAQTTATAAQAAALEQARAKLAAITDAVKKQGEQRASVAETLKQVARSEAAIRVEEAETEAQQAVTDNAKEARAKKVAARSKARAAAAKRARAAQQKATRAARAAAAAARALIDSQREGLETENLIARARAATTTTTEEKIAAEQRLIDIATRKQVLEVENSKISAEDKAARITAIQQLARAELTEKIKGIHTASAAIRKANKEARDREAREASEAFKTAVQPFFDATAALNKSASATGSAGLGQLAQSLQVAGDAALKLKDNLASTPEATAAVAGAVGGIASIAINAENARTQKTLEAEKQRRLATATTEAQRADIVAEFEAKKATSVEQAERRKAAILAVMELAKAAASFPNIPLVAAHVAAAGLFGAVAGGIIGGSPAAVGAPGGGGFSAAGGGEAAGAGQAASGAGVTIVNNFNQPLVTRQHIGKAVQGALRSIGTTGHAKAKGI